MSIKRWIAENTASLQGKTVAVTGSTGVLGGALCRHLASLGANLILLDRNTARAEARKQMLVAEFPSLLVRTIRADMEDAGTLKAACKQLENEPLDVLICNAGAYHIPRHTCDTGLDNVFQINFAAPYFLIRTLLPTLRKRRGRVVVMGSMSFAFVVTDPCDEQFSSCKKAMYVYGNAKRHLMLSLYELFREEHEASLAMAHPGICFTGITSHYPRPVVALIKYPMKLLFLSPKKASLGALAGLFSATGYHEWLGPCRFRIWGFPKKQKLLNIPREECDRIAATAERIYADWTNKYPPA